MLILIGMPGAGKSSIGRELARRSGLTFADSDAALTQAFGITVRAYFSQNGEEAFRDQEARMLEQLCQSDVGILATGGGSVLRPQNRSLMRAQGTVVYLHADPALLARRLRNDTTRPLLQVADPLATLHALYAQRDPLYKACAHHVMEVDASSRTKMARQLELLL